jgi:DNA-binding NtrC family response regulator
MSTDRPCLLIVEDTVEVRWMLVRAFTMLCPSCDVLEATTITDALAALATSQVSCVLTDYSLGNESGIALAHAIQADWPHVATILISGWVSEEVITEAMGAGCVAVLDKPITLSRLQATVLPVLERTIAVGS